MQESFHDAQKPPQTPSEANLLKCAISAVAYTVMLYVFVMHVDDRYMTKMQLVVSCAHAVEGPQHILLAAPVV